jgi:hypothetical protein
MELAVIQNQGASGSGQTPSKTDPGSPGSSCC